MTIMFRYILPILEFTAQQALKPVSRTGLDAVLIETWAGSCFQGGQRQALKNIKSGGLPTPSISINCFSSMGELLALEGSNSKCLVPWFQPDLGMSTGVTNKWRLKELELFFLQVWVRDTAPPQTVPIRPGVFKAAEVWGTTKDERLWRILEDQRIHREALSCWLLN